MNKYCKQRLLNLVMSMGLRGAGKGLSLMADVAHQLSFFKRVWTILRRVGLSIIKLYSRHMIISWSAFNYGFIHFSIWSQKLWFLYVQRLFVYQCFITRTWNTFWTMDVSFMCACFTVLCCCRNNWLLASVFIVGHNKYIVHRYSRHVCIFSYRPWTNA